MIAVPASLGAVQAGAANLAGSTDLSLTLPAGSGEQYAQPLGTGVDAPFKVELRNLGPSASDGQLTLTLPAGVELGTGGVVLFANSAAYDEGTFSSVPCSGATGTITCEVGTVGVTQVSTEPKLLELDLLASTGSTSGSTVGTPGTNAPFTVAIAATSATDTDSDNDSTGSSIDFTGVADLTYSITPVRPAAGVGRTTTLTLSVTNHGPQTAGDAFGYAAVEPNGHFTIASFDGPTSPSPAALRAGSAARKSAMKKMSRTAGGRSAMRAMAAGASDPELVQWFIGDIASGATATAHLTLSAKTTGSTQVLLIAGSNAADTGCVSDNDPCMPTLDTLTATPQATTAYIASSRVKSAVYINGLIKQNAPSGVVRSAGRSVYLQRYINGGWQNMLMRKSSTTGQLAVGFVQTRAFNYRLYVTASTTASVAASGKTVR